jgi:hypothetical protein
MRTSPSAREVASTVRLGRQEASNLALAVGPDVDYAVLERDGTRWLFGAATVANYEKELAGATPVATVKGKDLVGRTYRPLFPYFSKHPNSFRVLGGDFVDTAEGTWCPSTTRAASPTTSPTTRASSCSMPTSRSSSG